MSTPATIYRRKGTRVIYPFTEANAKNQNLIAMTVAEAQEEGLLAPRADASIDPEVERNNALAEENSSLRDKIKALEEKMNTAPPKATRKKRASKKIEVEKDEPVPIPDKPSSLADLGL